MPTKSVTVQYRRIDPFGNPAFSTERFDRMVAAALDFEVNGVALKDRAALRQSPSEHGFVRLLNNKQIMPRYAFGEIVRFEPGGLAPLINQSEEAADLDLLQQGAAAEHEFVHGIAYFMVRGNHMAIIERGMRAKQVGDYLTWLLRSTGQLVEGQAPVLVSKLDVTGDQGLDGVKSARLQLVGEDDDAPTRGAAAALHADVEGGGEVEGAQAWNILETLNMADGALVEAASVPGTKLQMGITFNLKRGRSTVELPEETLREYLENHPESEIKLEGDKQRRTGTVIILKERAEVEVTGEFIHQDSASQALFAALGTFEDQTRAQAHE